jgi:hypothetical protein
MTIENMARPRNASPWKKIDSRLLRAILVASVLPALFAVVFWAVSGLNFIVVLYAVFLPLQLLGGAYAGYI